MLPDATQDMIGETLYKLAETVYKETGVQMLIGWGASDGDELVEGCVTSPNMEYGTACKLLCGITGFATDWYGNKEE